MMKDIPLNEEAIEILNEALWFLKDERYQSVPLQCAKFATVADAEKFTSLEFFQQIRQKAGDHNGFPDTLVGHSFNSSSLQFDPKGSEIVAEEVSTKLTDFFQKLMSTFNLRRNALFSVYPAEVGYISWHNNANASAYNFIFTYSETGEGWWKHYDPIKDEIVTIPDVKGWQCKAGYFGSYQDGYDKIVYHAARNHGKGLRLTIAFTLDRSELSQGLQDWVIEDIRAD